MKKLSILLAALTLTGVAYGAQLEVKGGFEPWREGNNSSASFDQGGSLGAELLCNAENHNFDYGIGAEWKSEFTGGSDRNAMGAAKGNAFPIYLTGKYGIAQSRYYVVGRTGWSINEGTEDGFYGAAGLGAQFGKFTVETLYESMDLSGSSKMYSGDRVQLASIKFGYRFGENKRDVLSREKEEAARAEYDKQQADEAAAAAAAAAAANDSSFEGYDNVVVANGYDMSGTEPKVVNEEFLNNVDQDLANQEGTLVVTSYTDNTGSEAVNLKISQERADKAAAIIRERITNENIDVISEGKGETNFLNDNDTLENRKRNRRIEVNFIGK